LILVRLWWVWFERACLTYRLLTFLTFWFRALAASAAFRLVTALAAGADLDWILTVLVCHCRSVRHWQRYIRCGKLLFMSSTRLHGLPVVAFGVIAVDGGTCHHGRYGIAVLVPRHGLATGWFLVVVC